MANEMKNGEQMRNTAERLGHMANASMEQVRERMRMAIEKAKKEMKSDELPEGLKIAYEKHKGMSLGLKAIIETSDLLGPKGPVVRELAMELQNRTIEATKIEEKAKKKGFFRRLLFGGDPEAGRELNETVAEIDSRIQELKNTIEDCSCSAEVKAEILAKITEMEKEKARMKAEAEHEMKSRGLLGWLFRRK